MGTRKELKVGDLVRVPGRHVTKYWHAFKAGTVVEVVGINEELGDATLQGFEPGSGILQTQWLSLRHLKLAKQAMKKRDQYKNRR
jgi:hypothetical protein